MENNKPLIDNELEQMRSQMAELKQMLDSQIRVNDQLLKKNIIDKNIAIEKLQIENTEFVSFINEFPVSIKSIYLKANNLHFNQGLSNLDEEVANIDFNFDSGYYSDLFVKSFESKSILDKDGFIVKVPSVQFQKSKLTAAFGHEYTDDKYSFKLNAKNFDISDLNSNLTEHLFNGKLDRAQEEPQHHQHRNRQQIAPHLRLHNADPDRAAPCAQQEDINSAAQMAINRRMEHRSAGITKPHGKRDKPQRGKRIQKALFCRFTHSVLLPAPRIQMQYIMQTGKEQCGFGRFAESGKGIWPGTENKCKPYPIGGGGRER